MIEKPPKKQKQCFITEDDVSTILQRYTATTILALLQEMALAQEAKIDWNAMVKKTATGITNPREYQMLWRHLAYDDSLLDKFDDGAQPMDDDSDLENELEVFPPVSSEASAEAAACVKVLIASGSSDANGASGSRLDAPFTTNIPNSQASRASSGNMGFASLMREKNITVPIDVQKQPLPSVTSSENVNTNGTASGVLPHRRKRKQWSVQEDQDLLEAVQKYGEGNWANILKGSSKIDRTASQLSQRWVALKGKSETHGSQLSEIHQATREALFHALKTEMGDKLKSACSVETGRRAQMLSGNTAHPLAAEASAQCQAQCRQDHTPSAAQPTGLAGSSKTRAASNKLSTKATLSPDLMVKAAAVAAGARITNPSVAETLLKTAQSNKKAVHVMPGGGSLVKSSTAGNANQLPSNVHSIRNALAAQSLSTYSATPLNASRLGTSQQAPGLSSALATPVVESNPEDIVLGLGSSRVTGAASNLTNEHEVKTVGEPVRASSDTATRGLGKKDGAMCIAPGTEAGSSRAAVSSSLGTEAKEHLQVDRGSVTVSSAMEQNVEGEVTLSSSSEAKDVVQIVSEDTTEHYHLSVC